MSNDEMRACLKHWIEKFIENEEEKKRLLGFLEIEEVPVKSVLAALTPHFNDQFSVHDKDILQDLVYYYL